MNKYREDIIEASFDINKAKIVGLRDGFLNLEVKTISGTYDNQCSYLEGYGIGALHRRHINEICEKEKCTLEELLIKAFYYYRMEIYGY